MSELKENTVQQTLCLPLCGRAMLHVEFRNNSGLCC